MVVPCLTCTKRDGYKYTFDEKRGFYNYFLTCKDGIKIPQPVPKEGFVCDKYESRCNTVPSGKRSNCIIDVKHS
ncbi:MAG TPA: hypothetical protein O0X32_00850 [Methanocorpusculum sp.]|nr:hypothetical protein [Methanocorpusculum sp.]